MSDNALVTQQRIESPMIVKARELASRIKYMIVNGNKLSDPEVYALAQYAAANDLNPFSGECYYLPGTGPVAGIVGFRRKAQEAMVDEAIRANIKDPQGFWIEIRPALPTEANFNPDRDIAVVVTLRDSITNKRWRTAYFETARELKALGEEKYFEVAKDFVGPEPVWTGTGVVYGSETFARDGKPEKFDRYERAVKRAEKIALKKRFQCLHILEPQNGGSVDDDIVDTTFNEVPEAPRLKKSEPEILAELGFSDAYSRHVGDDEPAAQPAAPVEQGETTTEMSLADAEAVVNAKGVKYGEIKSETLSHMSAELAKSLNSPLQNDERAERNRKLQAIKVILAARNAAQ